MTDVTLEPWMLRHAAALLNEHSDALVTMTASKRALEIVAQFCEHTAEMMDDELSPTT